METKPATDPFRSTPESWKCVDCGMNTAPGWPARAEMKLRVWFGPVESTTGDAHTEVYAVHDAVWRKAGMRPYGGCLCIRCLEKRLGRRLKPKDFVPNHPFNNPYWPGTKLRANRLKKLAS